MTTGTMSQLFRQKRARGLTLIEILVALFVSSVVLAGILQIYSSSKQSYRVQEALSRLQENGRFGINQITKNLRMAGYLGCLSKRTLTLNNNDNRVTNVLNSLGKSEFLYHSYKQPVYGFHFKGGWKPALSESQPNLASLNPPPLEPAGMQNDALTIRHSERTLSKVQSHASNTANLVLDTTAGLAAGDIILLSSCVNEQGRITPSSYIAQITSIEGNTVHHCGGAGCSSVEPGNQFALIGEKNYERGTEVFRLQMKTYYVGQQANQRPALYELDHYRPLSNNDADRNPRILVEGVENMRVFYGIAQEKSESAQQYLSADEVTDSDWENVISIRIHLLLETENFLTDEKVKYFYLDPDTPVTATDNRFHRAFTTTVGLRNRIETE